MMTVVQHELDLFFDRCMERMRDTEKDWAYVIAWGKKYLAKKGNTPENRELFLQGVERLERKFGHANVKEE